MTIHLAITPPTVTNVPIHDLGMTDVEYAALVAQGYDPDLERQLIVIGEVPDKARKMARFVGLLKGKSPETESDWEELISDWDSIWAKG